MVFIGFLWSLANVVLALVVITLISYAWPDSTIGKTLGVIK